MVAGVAVALAGIAAATALIYALRQAAPVLSLGVVYLFVVLVVSIYWGLALGIATGLVSALAYNFSTSRRPASSRSPTARTGSAWWRS